VGSHDCVTSTLRPTAQKQLAGCASHEVEKPESFLRRNALSLACLSAFLVLLVGMVLTGWHSFNSDQVQHGEARLSLWSYFGQGHIWEALFENWESEFLQMAAYVVLTAYLIQRGSAESKNPDQHEAVDADPQDADRRHDVPWPVRKGGVVLKLYEHSLVIAFALLFIGSMLGHALGGSAEYNDELRAHGEAAVSTWQYVTGSQFWFESFQNWQSEFLAVFAIVVLTIFLREKDSSESKPVAAPHSETGTS
jgi:membrane protein implicated in regulation of membrane protease activity